MKQYFLSVMAGGDWFLRSSPLFNIWGDVCIGNHAKIHDFLNSLNPMLTEYFDQALESLWEKESAFIKAGDFQFCLTRLA